MQNGRDQGVGIEAQIRQDVGDRDGMRDIGLAGNPFLALMFFSAELVGFPDPLHLAGDK